MPASGFTQYLSRMPSLIHFARERSSEVCSTADEAILWWSEAERDADWGSGSVGSGRVSEILCGSLFDRLSEVGVAPAGDSMPDERGDCCSEMDVLILLSAGSAPFAGRPGPLFVPVVGDAACAMSIAQCQSYRAHITLVPCCWSRSWRCVSAKDGRSRVRVSLPSKVSTNQMLSCERQISRLFQLLFHHVHVHVLQSTASSRNDNCLDGGLVATIRL